MGPGTMEFDFMVGPATQGDVTEEPSAAMVPGDGAAFHRFVKIQRIPAEDYGRRRRMNCDCHRISLPASRSSVPFVRPHCAVVAGESAPCEPERSRSSNSEG